MRLLSPSVSFLGPFKRVFLDPFELSTLNLLGRPLRAFWTIYVLISGPPTFATRQVLVILTGKVRSRRSWLKQTIFLGQSGRSFGLKQTILAKADDPILFIFYIPKHTILLRDSRTKPDDPEQNILRSNRTILGYILGQDAFWERAEFGSG